MTDGVRQLFASGGGPEVEAGHREQELEVESTTVTKALLLACNRRNAPSRRGRPYAAGSGAAVWELLPVANRPVLFHTLDWLDAAGIRDVAIVVDGPTGSEVRDAVEAEEGWGLNVQCLVHDTYAGLGEVLSAAEPFLCGDAFMLHLGDSLTSTPPDAVLADGCGASEAVVFLDEARRNVVELASRQLSSGVRGAARGPRDALAGIALLGGDVVAVTRGLPSVPDCELELLATLERLSTNGGTVKARVVEDWWRYRGQPDALLDANRFMLEGVRGGPTAAQLRASHVQGNVAIHDSAVIESTTVRGPAVIGPRATLTSAYIGPYTSIGPDVVVEGAEIEHSIVFPGAKISHLGARLEASVIGSEARVFRDFKLPKGLRLYVGEGAEVSLA